MASSSVSAAIKQFQIIYPDFINKKKSQAAGRLLSKELCVENPTATEIYQCCLQLGFQTVLEPDRCYPRDPYSAKGRVRVLIKDSTKAYVPKSEFDKSGHAPMKAAYPTKLSVLRAVCRMIPNLQSRKEPQKPKEEESDTPVFSNKKDKRKGKKK